MTFGALRAAREHGVAVATDLSVIGFDDIPAGRTSHPPLRTVVQPSASAASLRVD